MVVIIEDRQKPDSGNKILMAFMAFALLLMLASTVSAVQTSNDNNGYVVEYPPLKTIPFNQSISFSFHIFNATSGGYINDSSLSCIFHLMDNKGSHLVRSPLTYTGDYDYFTVVDPGNFSYNGNYGYVVQCGDPDVGGFDSVPLVVTPAGHEPVGDVTFAAYTIIFIAIIFSLLFMFFYTFGGLVSLTTDVLDVSLNVGIYFALFVFKFFVAEFIGIPLMNDILVFAFEIAVWTNVILPLIAMFMTMVMGSFLRKKFPNVFGRMPGARTPYNPDTGEENID